MKYVAIFLRIIIFNIFEVCVSCSYNYVKMLLNYILDTHTAVYEYPSRVEKKSRGIYVKRKTTKYIHYEKLKKYWRRQMYYLLYPDICLCARMQNVRCCRLSRGQFVLGKNLSQLQVLTHTGNESTFDRSLSRLIVVIAGLHCSIFIVSDRRKCAFSLFSAISSQIVSQRYPTLLRLVQFREIFTPCTNKCINI